jgi:hypothetical protein
MCGHTCPCNDRSQNLNHNDHIRWPNSQFVSKYHWCQEKLITRHIITIFTIMSTSHHSKPKRCRHSVPPPSIQAPLDEIHDLLQAINQLNARLRELENKHFNLVWYSRSDSMRPDIVASRKEVEQKYPRETRELHGKHGDWEHGYNSGVLATARLIQGYVGSLTIVSTDEGEKQHTRAEEIQYAEEQFPMLAT